MEQEDFILEVMGKTVNDSETEKENLLKVAGLVKSEKVKTATDDGVTQTLTVKNGAFVERETIKNPILLRPYRTFPEVEQPLGIFNFRAHQKSDEVPRFSLNDADGGAWKLTAINNIKSFFKENESTKDVPILA